MAFFSLSDPLTITYVVMMGISFLFAVISLLGAELGDALDFDADIDSDGGLDLVNISPFALASFGATFGLVGLITRLGMEMNTLPSILWATVAALVFGGAAQALFVYVLSASKSSHFTLADDAANRSADVIVSIPNDGRGTIAYDNASGRVTLAARSSAGDEIRTGKTVIIERVVGRIAYVRIAED